MTALRVAVADDEAIMQMYLEEIVTELGHDVVAVAGNGQELVDRCRSCHPDLVITDIRMPVLDGVRAAGALCLGDPLPVLFVTGYYEEHKTAIDKSLNLLVYHPLIKPVGQAELSQGIAAVMSRFEEYRAVRSEAENAPAAREAFERLQRAKKYLMRREGLDETEAFDLLQTQARAAGTTLAACVDALLATAAE